jgi:hypothetical protein
MTREDYRTSLNNHRSKPEDYPAKRESNGASREDDKSSPEGRCEFSPKSQQAMERNRD